MAFREEQVLQRVARLGGAGGETTGASFLLVRVRVVVRISVCGVPMCWGVIQFASNRAGRDSIP